MNEGYLELADWRRQVAEIYARWRHSAKADPLAATMRLRAQRDELLRVHPQSPLPAAQRARFSGLSYFDYDPAYRMVARVEATAERAAGAPMIQLPTSGSEPFASTEIGRVLLSGPLAGAVLPLFWMAGYAGGLFLPFRDTTSGSETYGAGRYLLDTVKGADQGGEWQSGELMLDFNLAYHPSCAYDPKWNCPLAPPRSRLTLPVRAGERLA